MSNEPSQPEVNKPLLTIAIPTYNRAWCLRELLPVLEGQLKNESRVELIISDNASPDETPSVVQEFGNRGLRVKYIRNPENIGPDGNFLQCFEQARGKYVWLFSDDDLIVPGGLAKILNYCQSAEYDLIFLNHYSFQDSHSDKFPVLRAGTDAIDISDPKDYARRVHVFFTFISGNIINKDRLMAAGPQPFSTLVGTSLVQLGWAYAALNGFVRGLFVQEELFAVRLGNTGGYKLFQVFGPTLDTITKNWLRSESLRRIIMNGTVQRFWPPMMLKYKKCAKDFAAERDPREILTPVFGGTIRYWAFVYPVMVLPSALASVWVFFVRIVNRMDKAAGFPTLGWGVDVDGGSRQ
jgi:abequosyltransferase